MKRGALCWIAGTVALLLQPQSLVAGENVLLLLKGRSGDVKGEGPKGYESAIECFAYEQAAGAPVQPGSAAGGPASGKLQYQPITIRKRIDRTTPQIARLLAEGDQVEATFRFFRKAPNGMMANFYTVEIKGGRVVARKDVVASTVDAATAKVPEYEEVSFSFTTIKWRWEEAPKIETADDLLRK